MATVRQTNKQTDRQTNRWIAPMRSQAAFAVASGGLIRRMEFLHPAMWHDHDIDFARRVHPAVWHVAVES